MTSWQGRRSRLPILFLGLLFAVAAQAQDERSVRSPDGQLEFRLLTARPEGSIFNCLAYQVWWHGKPLVETSFLSLSIHFEEPWLGENVGLSSDKQLHGDGYNGLWADYMQVSTTGKRLYFEVRVYNDGVAFRYIVPTSALLFDLLLEDDETQFRLAGDPGLPERSDGAYQREIPGVGWVGIYLPEVAGFPKSELRRFDSHTFVTHLADNPKNPGVAFETKTPWTGPWHVVAIGASREQLSQSQALQKNR